MTPARRQALAFALLALVMILWAGNSIVGRAVRFDVPPLTLAFVRWLGATLILLPFAWRALARDRAELVRGWKPVLALGLLGVGIFNALLYSGLTQTTATNALLLQAAVPAAVVLLDRLIFGERSPGVQNVGVALSMIGVAAVVFEGDPARALDLALGMGDVLILLSAVVWALYTVLLRQRPAIAPLSFLTVTFAIGALTMAPLAAYEALAGQRVHWTPLAIGAFAYVSVLPSIVAYMIFNWAAGIVGPARAGIAITALPVFGAFMSAAILGEPLRLYHFAGMALIVLGIALSIVALRRQGAAGAGAEPPLEQRP